MDNFFVNALVRASLCKIHSSSHPSPGYGGSGGAGGGVGIKGVGGGGSGYSRNCPLSRLLASTSRRGYHQSVVETELRPPYEQEIKSELISFADPYYDSKTHPEHDKKSKDIAAQTVQSKPTKKLPWLCPSTPEDKAALKDFFDHLNEPATSLEHLFQLYQKLPSPQIPHLTAYEIDIFVGRMMAVPLRDETNMFRYLSILGDMKAAKLHISRNEWNAAVSSVARCSREVTIREAKSTIQIWKESELTTGVASNTVTFNILLDMASRSDAPVLVEWILNEMKTRKISPDRSTHTTIITLHGFHQDGEKVREAYRNFVEAGEIVDTVVLNAVMSALIRAQQPQSAEYIYENMKRATLDPPSPVPVTGPGGWMEKRAWAKNLKRIARKRRIINGYMKEFSASMAPDVYTFNMLILQCSRNGDYDRAQVLLEDMKVCAVGIDDSIFIAVLKGFDWYGGMRNSRWTRERLDTVIKQVLGGSPEIIMGRSLAIWILRAVAKVYNSKQKVLRAWDIVERRWKCQGGVVDEATVQVLQGLVGWDAMPREPREKEEEMVEKQAEGKDSTPEV